MESNDIERQFQAIFNDPNTFIGILGLDGNLLIANKTALDFIGSDGSDVQEKKFWDTPWWTHSEALQKKLKFVPDAIKSVMMIKKRNPGYYRQNISRND